MNIGADTLDSRVRLGAFKWLKEQHDIHGDTLSRELLAKGFSFEGTRVPLVGPQGIFKPKILPEVPLTITTSPNSPYDDDPIQDRYFLYKYRSTGPEHRDNNGLRLAMGRRIPLIYFCGIERNRYVSYWPVYVVGDDPEGLSFRIQVDDKVLSGGASVSRNSGEEEAKRGYLTVQARMRLHQQRFRERVLGAYGEQCAMCRLKHRELLEAVHIIPDAEPGGIPTVNNGIAMCALHHSAFDRCVLGIRPDYVIEVRGDVLKEKDGPILLHGLQKLNQQEIQLPKVEKYYPDPDKLEIRYQRFRSLVA